MLFRYYSFFFCFTITSTLHYPRNSNLILLPTHRSLLTPSPKSVSPHLSHYSLTHATHSTCTSTPSPRQIQASLSFLSFLTHPIFSPTLSLSPIPPLPFPPHPFHPILHPRTSPSFLITQMQARGSNLSLQHSPCPESHSGISQRVIIATASCRLLGEATL